MNDGNARLTAALSDRYRIERELGAGGMATVYLAEDLKHDRKVAIKVLRPELAAVIGAERFLAEIKTTANLQHPHILSLFDSGEVGGTVFYVMPFVEGESLRDTLTREKQLPVDDAIRLSCEVADALQYAHQHGVIHRDIKPENILVQSGHALVADFGIALAAAKVGGTRMTETGMSLGTPTYMSPEQAMGERELDARTDIYALGCVAYEMLTGEPPFTGPTAQAIVAKVVTEPAPSVQAKRGTVPDAVDDAIRTALQKTPADRFRTAAEFASTLQRAGSTGSRAARPNPPWPKSHVPRLIGAIALSLAAFLLGGRLLGRHGGPPLEFGRTEHVTWDPGLEVLPALSPDGKSVAFASGSLLNLHIMVRPVGEGRAIALTSDTTAPETDPQWAPDGSRILFLARGGAFSAPASGGPARPEIPGDTGAPVTSATWAPDGNRMAFTRGDSLYMRETAGTVHPVARLPQANRCTWSPDGTFVACASGNPFYANAGTVFGNQSPSSIVLCRVRDGTVTAATDSLSLNHSPAWSGDGKWLYFVSNRDGPNDIYGVPVSGAGGGPVVRLSTGLGAHTISLSPSGSRLAYSRYSSRSSIWSLPIPTNPPVTSTQATRLTNANETIESVTASPDGKWLLYDSDLPGNADLFRLPLAGGEPEQLTTTPADDFAPDASPDGKEVAFHSWRGGSRDIYVMRLDGGGIQQVTRSPLQEGMARWSPDGKAIAFTQLAPPYGLWVVRRDAAGQWGTPRQIRASGFFPLWSPDGRSIAFTTTLLGGIIKTMPADSGTEHEVVSATRDVAWAAWGKDGVIYYSAHDQHGNASIWGVPGSGGTARQIVRLDPVLHPSFHSAITVGNGHLYFTSEDRQSDIWVMEVKRP